MSQSGILSISSSPAVPTSFVADSGSAVPVANILNILGSDTSVNDDDGIRTIASGNTVTVQLTNRVTGSITTNDATPTTALTFSLGATPGVYYIDGNITAFNSTDIAGGVYNFVAGFRTTGVAGTEIGSEDKSVFEEAAMATADFSVSVSGNNVIVVVTGIAAKTISWDVLLNFRFVS